ncbi:MAG: ATP-binding cassette domain-containing protein, partial [Flavobacterium sp.]|nr:ATP-binding cassette domain-containing protein [Flavobacterium sp.]
YPQQLSGGQQQRAAVARALVTRPKLILADEPTAHLDQETAGRIADSLVSLAKGKTLIISTHDEKLASRMDRIVRLDDLSANAQLWQKRAAE